MTPTCEAHVWAGDTWHPIRAVCGRPAKGSRFMGRSETTLRPACGIHLRDKAPLWWADKAEARR